MSDLDGKEHDGESEQAVAVPEDAEVIDLRSAAETSTQELRALEWARQQAGKPYRWPDRGRRAFRTRVYIEGPFRD